MARSRTPPPAASPEATATPSYVAPPADVISSDSVVLDNLRDLCGNASYCLLDQRDGRWCLLVFGAGQIIRHFDSMQDGIDFVREVGIGNCRCLHVPGGLVK